MQMHVFLNLIWIKLGGMKNPNRAGFLGRTPINLHLSVWCSGSLPAHVPAIAKGLTVESWLAQDSDGGFGCLSPLTL